MNWSARIACCLVLVGAACGDDGLQTNVNSATGDSCACRLASQYDNLAICASPATALAPAHVYSTNWDAVQKKASCDPYVDPQPAPSAPWTSLSVSSACTGTGTLCITVKAGDYNARSPDDCVLASDCSSVDNQVANQIMQLPPLAGWSAAPTCAARQAQLGAYMELSLDSQTLGCNAGSDEVRRFPVCPTLCQDTPSDARCKVCNSVAVTTTL